MVIDEVEVFVEIAQEGSISRAAQKLFLTQPTVTKRLQNLEAEICQPLFVRVPRGVVLTDAGKLLLPYAIRSLKTLAEAKAALKLLQDATGGSLFIGSATLVSAYVMPTLLTSFAQRHPDVHVVIRSGHSHEIVERVLTREVQIGLAYQATHPDLVTAMVYPDELLFVARSDHPLCQFPAVSAEDIGRHPFVLLGGVSYRRVFGEAFANTGMPAPPPALEVDNAEIAKKIILESDRSISLLHRIAIQRELDLRIFKAIYVDQLPNTLRPIYVIHHKTSGLGGLAKAFLTVVEELASAPH